MTRWRWTLLIFELLLIALILVLPQVDLPDYTFHGGTAPMAAKARVSRASTGAEVSIIQGQTVLPSRLLEAGNDHRRVDAGFASNALLAMLCTFLC